MPRLLCLVALVFSCVRCDFPCPVTAASAFRPTQKKVAAR